MKAFVKLSFFFVIYTKLNIMKTFFLAFSLMFILGNLSVSGQSSVKKIVKQLKNTENYEGISLPGWLIRMGLNLAVKVEGDESNSELFKWAGKIKHLRVATTKLNTKKYNTGAIINNFMKEVQENDGFEEYMSVRSEDQHLKIMVQEVDHSIKNLLIFSDENGEIAFIHLKTNFLIEDLQKISFRNIKQDSQQYKIEVN